MRQFYTAVLDTFRDLENGYTTEPYEVAWASEAIFFIRTEEVRAGAGRLYLSVELSADGMTWAEEGSTLVVDPGRALSFVRLSHFGGWLRLRHFAGAADCYQVTVSLVLKE